MFAVTIFCYNRRFLQSISTAQRIISVLEIIEFVVDVEKRIGASLRYVDGPEHVIECKTTFRIMENGTQIKDP